MSKEYDNQIIDALLNPCTAQRISIVYKGRETLKELPREYILANIHKLAVQNLDLSNEWEYRRLMEVYQALDVELVKILVDYGKTSGIKLLEETAIEFEDDVEEN